MIDGPIYRNERRTISWGTDEHQSARPGYVIVDPPEYVAERFADQFVRIDEEGYVPRYDLENMRLEDARRIADHADTDAVDGSSSREAIVDALSPDIESESATDPADEEERDENPWQALESESERTVEDLAAERVASDIESESGSETDPVDELERELETEGSE